MKRNGLSVHASQSADWNKYNWSDDHGCDAVYIWPIEFSRKCKDYSSKRKSYAE